MILLSLLFFYLGIHNDVCPSSVLPGISLGQPGDFVMQQDVATWEDCRNLCCSSNTCVAWTFLVIENICLLRKDVGTNVVHLQNKNQISGITQSHILKAPHRSRKELLFYVAIASAPTYWTRVNIYIPTALYSFCRDGRLLLTFFQTISRVH